MVYSDLSAYTFVELFFRDKLYVFEHDANYRLSICRLLPCILTILR
jgi:hypothetical protein